MSEHSDKTPDWKELRQKIIGLGEESVRKSYYPELQQRLAELQESEARFRTIFDSINDAIFVHDPRTSEIIQVNHRACELYGYTCEELQQLSLGELSSGEPPYTQENADALLQKAAEGEPQVFKWHSKDRYGELFWVEVNLRRAILGGNEQVLAVVRDITDRMVAEEAVKRSEKRYRSLVELMPAGVVVHSNFIIVYVNPTAVRAARVESADQMVGRPIWDFIAPEYKDEYQERYEHLLRGENHINVMEGVLRDKEGIAVEVEGIATVIEFDGKPAILSMFSDITKRKRAERALRESEEQFRILFEMANDAILLLEDMRVVTCNAKALEIFGCASKESFIGSTAMDFSPPKQPDGSDSAEKALDKLRAALSGEPQFFEWQHKRCDGSLFDAEVNLQAINLRGKKALQTVIRDITERKRIQEEKKAFYRQTILAATNGILDICDEDEIEPYLDSSLMHMELHDAEEVGIARRAVEKECRRLGLEGESLALFILAIGEALTNAVKHSSGGSVYVGKTDDEVWVAICDQGSGIESIILPSAVLRRGFSTKPSLGLGYSVMLDVCNHILLKTDKTGTSVVLFKKIHKSPMSMKNIPDTWAGIPNL